MNSSETQETPANASPAPAEPAQEAKHETPAAAPQAASSSASASADDHDDGDEGDAEGEGEAAAGGAAAEGAPGDGTKKKRRRRRRKKHGANAEGAAAGAEGAPAGEAGAAPAEGAAANGEAKKHDGKKKNDKKGKGKPHHDPHRERPAFAVGDVVFGKITDIGEDAIFVDVAGKAKAVFDKLELLLPEDVADTVEEDARKGEAEAEAIMRGGKPEDAAAEGASTEEAAAETTEHVEAAPAPAASEPAAEENNEAAAPAAASAEGENAEGAAPAAASGEEAKPGIVQLPRVVLEAGATFVGVVHNDGGRGGMVVLTHHPKRAGKAKPAVAAAFKNKTEIFGLVTGVIKGGVEVDVDGLRAFAPGSHMSLHLGHDLHHLVGKRLPFSVTQYAKRGRDVVLSRKAMLETEAKAARELALSKVKPGDTVEGTVRSVVPFGAFVDIGGVEGLVSLSEMSHNRSDSPSDVFKVGSKTTVLIQKIDDKGKIWLSHKATIPDPWGDVATKYALGTKHTGKVVRIQPFGAFVELESGVDGLIHTSDLFGLPPKKAPEKGAPSNGRIEHPNEVVAVGDSLDVVVSSLDTGTHKIALHPAPTGEAANETPQRVALHKMVKVVVVAAEATGLVVRVLGATGRHSRGYITGAATGTPRGTELRKIFPVGKELEAKVIEIDPRRGEAKLSIKAVQQDTERNAYQQYRQQVKREAKFGTFGDLLNQATAKKNPQK
ncbi:MAG TPA: S1 RNA-binding domain-containing protein [Polyangiaceae bacterium]